MPLSNYFLLDSHLNILCIEFIFRCLLQFFSNLYLPCLRSIPFYSNCIIILRFLPFFILLFYFFYFSIKFIFLFMLELRKFSNAFSANVFCLMLCFNKNLLG